MNGPHGRPLAGNKKPCFSCYFTKAGDRTRTGDIQLGKLALYQLSYARRRVNGEGMMHFPSIVPTSLICPAVLV
jgi:hypothetical protein